MLNEYVQRYLDFLQGHHPLLGVAAIAVGVLFLTNGWKIFKFLIATDAIVLGMKIGAVYGAGLNRQHMDVILGIGGGLIFAALVWPLMKWAVCALGAFFGAVVGYVLWYCTAQAAGHAGFAHNAWVGGLVGLITMALLAFIIFRTVAVVVTSLQGAWLVVSGVGSLALAVDGLNQNLLNRLHANPVIVPVMILIPGVLGIIYQESKFLTIQAKKRKTAMAVRN